MCKNEARLANELIEFVAATVTGIKNSPKENEQAFIDYLHCQYLERFQFFWDYWMGESSTRCLSSFLKSWIEQ